MIEDTTTVGWLDGFLRRAEMHLTLVGYASHWCAVMGVDCEIGVDLGGKSLTVTEQFEADLEDLILKSKEAP